MILEDQVRGRGSERDLVVALPWFILGPAIGGLGIGHLVRRQWGPAGARFLVTAAGLLFGIFVLAVAPSFDIPLVAFLGVPVYAAFWVVDCAVVVNVLVQQRRPAGPGVKGSALVTMAWCLVFIPAAALALIYEDLLIGNMLVVWLVAAAFCLTLSVFLYHVFGAIYPGSRNLLRKHVVLAWLGGLVGAFGLVSISDGRPRWDAGLNAVGLTLVGIIALTAVRNAQLPSNGFEWGFDVLVVLYVGLWGSSNALSLYRATLDGHGSNWTYHG